MVGCVFFVYDTATTENYTYVHTLSLPVALPIWGRNSFRWVRPLHHVLAVFDGAVLDGGLDLGDRQLQFTGDTRGHRFLAPDPLPVESFADYRGKLQGAFVMLDRKERKQVIAAGIAALAAADGLVVRGGPGLVEEVCGLV